MTEAIVKDFNGADFSMNTVFYNIDDKSQSFTVAGAIEEMQSLDKVKDDVSKAIENKGVMALSILDSESVKGTRTMVTDLLVLILVAFALIILMGLFRCCLQSSGIVCLTLGLYSLRCCYVLHIYIRTKNQENLAF